MAYITQAEKKELAPGIKKVLKEYGLKGTIGINHHSTLVVNIKEGKLDLIGAANKQRRAFAERNSRPYYDDINGCFQANPYRDAQDYEHIDSKIASFYKDLIKAMKGLKWFDKSDIMTDYHHVAYYLSINVGRSYKQPYVVTA